MCELTNEIHEIVATFVVAILTAVFSFLEGLFGGLLEGIL